MPPEPTVTQREPIDADFGERGWDALVVGAGPAGALAARRLAAAGHRVLVADARRFPRDKACGDALIPDAQACLARNGLLDRVAAVAWKTDRGDVLAPDGTRVTLACPALTVPRRVLDAILAEGAVEAGAAFVHARVEGIEDRGPAGVRARIVGRDEPLRARIAVVATGAPASLLAECGLLDRRRASAVAIRSYVRSSHRIDRMLVSFERAILPGYGWIFPVGDDRYNVGCGIVLDRTRDDGDALRPMLDRFLGAFTDGRALLGAATERGPVRGAVLRTALRGARPWSGGAVLATGEAIGTTFPLTGEGIGKAMESAECASDAVDAALRGGSLSALAAYPARLDAELRPRYRGYELAERWIAHPWLADLVFRRAARSARVRGAMAGILNETVDPERVFSPGGVLRALLS